MGNFLLPLLFGGISALGGALGNKKQQTQQNSVTDSTNQSRPVYDAKTGDVRDFLLNNFMDRVQSAPDFIHGYQANGIQNINDTAGAASDRIRQLMISRGLGRTSAGISPYASSEFNRLNQTAQFNNSLPMVADDYQRKNLTDFSQFFATLPTGTDNTTHSITNGTSITPSNSIAGGLQSGSQVAALLYGMLNGAKK